MKTLFRARNILAALPCGAQVVAVKFLSKDDRVVRSHEIRADGKEGVVLYGCQHSRGIIPPKCPRLRLVLDRLLRFSDLAAEHRLPEADRPDRDCPLAFVHEKERAAPCAVVEDVLLDFDVKPLAVFQEKPPVAQEGEDGGGDRGHRRDG